MNCLEFENVVVDLARGAVTDSSLGTRCWAHAANCPRCAERLLDQEKLTAGMEALTSRTDAMRAPERFEPRLRSEFRAHLAKSDGLIAGKPLDRLRLHLNWIDLSRWAWVGAAAIILLALAGVLLLRNGTQLPANLTPRNGTVARSSEPSKAIEAGNMSNQAAGIETSTKLDSGASAATSAPTKRIGTNKSDTPATPAFHSMAQDELATNFYPLPYGSGLPLDDGWEIVRVSMPGSALAKFGVPVPGEQSSTTTINADLVIGEDGMARAIRFVE